MLETVYFGPHRVRGIFLAALLSVVHSVSAQTSVIELPVETVIDKIRGGLLGQLLGNLNGLPYEFKYVATAGDLKNYVPSLPNGAFTDDDTDFEWVYVYRMQQDRVAMLPYDTIFALWRNRINRNIWSSNRYARFLMDMGMKPPLTGNSTLNPWAAFNVSGQFLCETFGLVAPAMPQTASAIGLHYTRVAIDGEPAQTTQFFASMVSLAFVNDDVDKILAGGIAALDPASNTLKIARDVINWHNQYPRDWQTARQLLKDKYTQEGSRRRDVNGTELNTGAIVMALLYGEGDFSETMKLAFNMGWDADCNAATLGTILGARMGYRAMMQEGWMVVDRYRNTTRDHMPLDETITSFADRIIAVFEMVNEERGGIKDLRDGVPSYLINAEKPAPRILVGSPDEQRMWLIKNHGAEIDEAIRNGTREERARAAYMAICLDMAAEMKKKHAKDWAQSCHDLSGYWRIMNNIFYPEFNTMEVLKQKFVAAGFHDPLRKYADQEIYNQTVVWKEPAELYR